MKKQDIQIQSHSLMPILRKKLAYISQIIEHCCKLKLAGSELLGAILKIITN
jgi:hypothetical protein